MESLRDDQLIADLQALRPTPRPRFAAELDERAAAGFPRRSRLFQRGAPALFTAMRNKKPADLRRLLPVGAFAVMAIAVVIAVNALDQPTSPSGSATNQTEAASPPSGTLGLIEKFGAEAAAPETASPSATSAANAEVKPFSQTIHHRAVERSAEITLAAKPEDVADDVTKVFEAVHAHDGIVMRSSTQEGRAGEAGAAFELLIPSAKLGDAMAAFSEIDHVHSRHEATADITAPTVSAAELLKESRARIDSLLAQLEAAGSEEEREAIEAELRHERRHASRLAAQLTQLHRRADFSRVSLRIETGDRESSAGGVWGIDDALHDAGHVLTVVAAVTLIALAVLGPIALIALLAWLTHRTWVRRERRRVLG
jgi:hypothetical protein